MNTTFSEFLAMGGHGGYVWSAYGITLLVLMISGWATTRRHREALKLALRAGPPAGPARKPKVTEI